ncbi:Uncharacterised protein [Mycobacterium tuberculosis]|nr:Uncharacterised protein [Mycobacterium tuberculosis]
MSASRVTTRLGMNGVSGSSGSAGSGVSRAVFTASLMVTCGPDKSVVSRAGSTLTFAYLIAIARVSSRVRSL